MARSGGQLVEGWVNGAASEPGSELTSKRAKASRAVPGVKPKRVPAGFAKAGHDFLAVGQCTRTSIAWRSRRRAREEGKEKKGRGAKRRRSVGGGMASYPSCPMDPTTSADLGPADDAKRRKCCIFKPRSVFFDNLLAIRRSSFY